MDRLSEINSSIKDLRIVLKNANDRQSVFELSEIIKDTKDARAFIFLLDRFDTDKEITRESIEDLIEHTYDFNKLVVEHISKLSTEKSIDIDKFLNWKTFKLVLAGGIVIAVMYGVANSDQLLKSALNHIGIQIIEVPKDANLGDKK